MTDIEKKRRTMELKKVEAGKEELELKIMEHLEGIENVKKSIAASDKRIAELTQELADNK